MDEKELIERSIKGDRIAQEKLYRVHADKMYSISRTYCENDADACDILQEGFIKVFRNLHMFENKGSFEGWIRKIIINTALAHFRKKKKQREVFSETVNYNPIPVIDSLIEKIKTADLIKMVNMLPERAKMVIKLFAIEGYSHQEIAEIMGITVGTSKSQLNRARSILKEQIEKGNG